MVATGSKLLVVRNCQDSHTLTAQGLLKKSNHAVRKSSGSSAEVGSSTINIDLLSTAR